MRRPGWTMLGLVLLTVLSGSTGSLAEEGAIVAVVLKVKNDVRQRPAGGAEWKPAEKGQPLVSGHELRTGENSFCALVFRDDQSLLKITSNTEVTLNAEEATAERFSKRIWVGVGGIWVKATHQEDATFEIETPTSVASVKGSSCYDMIDVAGLTTLFVLEGLFDFSNPFGQVLIDPGFKGFSNGVDPPSRSRADPEEVPTFAQEETIEGLEPQQEGQDKQEEGGGDGPRGEQDIREIRIGMRDEDGTERTLVIRYREPQEE